MSPKKTRAFAKPGKGLQSQPRKIKLPPDPDGTFRRAAARAKKVIAMYDRLSPGLGKDCLVHNILHDLMHLCDRDQALGDFGKDHAFAVYLYEELIRENLEYGG